ncbi:MAG: amidohydrolase family protein, partial [Microbacterium sp.]
MNGPARRDVHRANDAHVHITPRSVDPMAGEQAYLRDRDAHGIGISAIVTPSTMGWDNETSFAVAARDPERFRVIARADVRHPDAAQRVAGLLARGASGIRLTLLGDADISWLTDGTADEASAVLDAAGAVVEMHAGPEQLPAVGRFAARWARTRVVIDHLGRPDPARGPDSPGFTAFLALAEHPHITAKTPNTTFFSRSGAPFRDLVPFYESALEAY